MLLFGLTNSKYSHFFSFFFSPSLVRAHEEACEGVAWEYRKEEEETFNEEREEGRENKAHRLPSFPPTTLVFAIRGLLGKSYFISSPYPSPFLLFNICLRKLESGEFFWTEMDPITFYRYGKTCRFYLSLHHKSIREKKNRLFKITYCAFVLVRPSTDWMRPTHFKKGNLLCSVYRFKC